MRKIKAVILKEWAEVFKRKMVILVIIFMPLLFTIIPLVILFTMRGSLDSVAMDMGGMPDELSAMCSDTLTAGECMQFSILSQFLILYMMLPLIVPVTIASYSIVGEKSTHTLEPVLATPIKTVEFLAGKGLAAVLPGLIVTWISFGVFIIGTMIMSTPALVKEILAPMWMLSIFLLGPLLAIAGVSVSVMVSSRVNDPRVAEQVSSLVVIPLVGLMMGQSFGLFTLSNSLVLWTALLLFILDAILLYFAIQLFQRETILTRWK